MSGSINVLVRDKETRQDSIITYKSFRDTSYRFDLLGQVDDNGNLMESDPNLSPQHQRKIAEKKAADVNVGDKQFNTDGAITPGWLLEKGQNQADDIFINKISTPSASLESNSSISNPNSFHVEQSNEAYDEVVIDPIKERKKPGPKPKNREI